ncbi:Periaxin [Manis pentadactyla]|nr:Periaxin [Manis pentadactyla]
MDFWSLGGSSECARSRLVSGRQSWLKAGRYPSRNSPLLRGEKRYKGSSLVLSLGPSCPGLLSLLTSSSFTTGLQSLLLPQDSQCLLPHSPKMVSDAVSTPATKMVTVCHVGVPK